MSLYSTLDEKSIQSIINQYTIGSITHYKILQGGSANTNYYLRTKEEQYVLTLCERKTIQEANALATLLIYLENQGFETTKIIQSKEGKYVTSFQNKPILLKKYIVGTVKNSFEKDLLCKTGQAIAQLNKIPPLATLPNCFSYGQQAFSLIKNLQHPFVTWLSDSHSYIKKNLHPDLPKALIHGDIFTSNIIISKMGLPIIMDFEEACYYYRIFDLGMAIVGLCCEDSKVNLLKTQYLIAGYQEITPLSTLEKEKLQSFIFYAATATAFWRFRQFNILFPTEEHRNRYLEMQKIAKNIMETNWIVFLSSL